MAWWANGSKARTGAKQRSSRWVHDAAPGTVGPMPLVPQLRRVAGAARRRVKALRQPRPPRPAPRPPLASDQVPIPEFVRYGYNLILGREPDEGGRSLYEREIGDGSLSRDFFCETLYTSMEFRDRRRPSDLLVSLHLSRCDFARAFPPARRILDLGGTHQSDRNGALVAMGYPHRFDELVIVDLPHGDRHDLYSHSDAIDEHPSPLGPVRYRYHSMVDLSAYPDGTFDLVYSGQTIEHVTEPECDTVLAEVHRVLRPGGWLCLDTPNGPVCRLQQDSFINPDHKVEYSHAEFVAKLADAGFDVREAKGLNWAGPVIRSGRWDSAEVARHVGVYGVPEECYLLAYVARKPA